MARHYDALSWFGHSLGMIWVDHGRLLEGLRGTLGASCVPMLRSWGPLGLPWGSHGCSRGYICVDFLGKYNVFHKCHRRDIWRSLDSFGCIRGALGQASCVIEGPCGRPWDILGRFGDPLGCFWQPLEGLMGNIDYLHGNTAFQCSDDVVAGRPQEHR